MNICYININKGNRGGIETATEVIAEQLVIRKHNVFIVCDKMGENKKYRECRNFQTVEIPCTDIDSEQNKNFLMDFFKNNKINIVILQICYVETTNLIVKSIRSFELYKIKLISCWHHCLIIETDSVKGLKYYIKKLLNGLVIRKKRYYAKKFFCDLLDKSDSVVLLCEEYCKQLRSLVARKKLDKLQFISSPLVFPQETVDYSKKKKQLLFVGRFHEAPKRISLILKIWERITKLECYNDWELKLVGSGNNEEYEKIKMLAKNLPRIGFEGWQEPYNYYKESPIFIMTSAFEGFPLTLLESQSLGCVPVAMDSFASLYDIIQDGRNGFIVPNNDLNTFVKKVCILMDNVELRENMAENGIESVKKFSVENTVNKWEELLHIVNNNSWV